MLVVDLSHHNSGVDFVKMRAAGAVGIIHKATQGLSYVDYAYEARRVRAQAAGLLWGAYHFGTDVSASAQAAHFLGVAKPDDRTLLALDFEENGANTMSLAGAKQFVGAVESRVGRRPLLYTGSLVRDLLGDRVDAELGRCRLWWAQYADAPRVQVSWTSPWLWQHSDGFHGALPHAIDGVGPCDCNLFDGTEDRLREQWAE